MLKFKRKKQETFDNVSKSIVISQKKLNKLLETPSLAPHNIEHNFLAGEEVNHGKNQESILSFGKNVFESPEGNKTKKFYIQIITTITVALFISFIFDR